MRIPFSRVSCDGNELDYVREVLESGWLTTASKTELFESRFSELIGTRFACAVNSCTAALHLAMEALGVSEGDRVFVPTMTFTATAEIIRYLGADPVFLDVDPETNLVTPEILSEAIDKNPDVRVLAIVHFGGQTAEMLGAGGIVEICKQHGIRIVEDAAHAFPARDGSVMAGRLGDVSCFSFYANKTITTGEGGMLLTDDESIAKRAKVMRLHGMDRDSFRRYTSKGAGWEYDVVAPGYKYNMPDLNAAVGLAQLERATAMRDERERCVHSYYELLSESDVFRLPARRVDWADHAWHLLWIRLAPNAPVTRAELAERLNADSIGTSVHYKPLHRMTYYRERYSLQPEEFPGAEEAWQSCLSLPVYPSLEPDDLEFVCERLLQHAEVTV